MTSVDRCAEFLRARLGGDEAAAVAARGDAPGRSGRWHAAYSRDDLDPSDWLVATTPLTYVPAVGPGLARTTAEHIARWDPARVLAHVAAVRDVIGVYETVMAGLDDGGPRLAQALLYLAQPYAGHPDFSRAWEVPR